MRQKVSACITAGDEEKNIRRCLKSVEWADEIIVCVHKTNETFNQIIDITERTGLGSVAEYGNRFVTQGLENKIGNDAAVVGMHAWPVGIKDSSDFDAQLVLAVVIEEQGFGAAFAFVIT